MSDRGAKQEQGPSCWFERDDGTLYYDDSPAWWFWSFRTQTWHWETDNAAQGGHNGMGMIDDIGVTVYGRSSDVVNKRNVLISIARLIGSAGLHDTGGDAADE